MTARERQEVEDLQGRFRDMEVWMKAAEANGKMIPSLGNIAIICHDMAKLCNIIKKVA